MINDLDYFLNFRLKHLKLERGKIPFMTHTQDIKENMQRLMDGRIRELTYLRNLNKKHSLKGCGDYEKSKVNHLSKMRKFSVQHYNGK